MFFVVAWLGTCVLQGRVKHLEDSCGFRCWMELDEGIKLFDVCTRHKKRDLA